MCLMRELTFAATILCVAVLACASAAIGADVNAVSARKALEETAKVYATVPALRETMTYVVKSPGGDQQPKRMVVLLGSGSNASVADPVFQAVAVGDRMYVSKHDDMGHYVMRPYGGDFSRTLDSIFGEHGELFEPVEISMRAKKPFSAWLKSLRFRLLNPLTVTSFHKELSNGKAVASVTLTADNGSLVLRIDAGSHLLSSFALHVHPAGAPTGMYLDIDGTFSSEVVADAGGLVKFEPAGRTKVADLVGLTSAGLSIGSQAPAIELVTLEGERVALAELKGFVVVLDFWATWCAPCWEGLRESQRLHEWAKQSGARVKVFAVNTLEQSATVAEKQARAAKFLQSQQLDLPCLLDSDGAAFRGIGSPGLPSTVVLGPTGVVTNIHQGLFPNMLSTLKDEISQAAPARP
jgi:peroxiredoxin